MRYIFFFFLFLSFLTKAQNKQDSINVNLTYRIAEKDSLNTNKKLSDSVKVLPQITAHHFIVAPGNLQLYRLDPNYHTDILGLEQYIKLNNTLPNFPSPESFNNREVDLGELQMKLLEKIQELTFIVIEQNKHIEKLEKEINRIKKVIVLNR